MRCGEREFHDTTAMFSSACDNTVAGNIIYYVHVSDYRLP